MIDNIYGEHGAKAVTCDNCGDGFEADSWEESQRQLKLQGWKTSNKSGHFEHFCPDCKDG